MAVVLASLVFGAAAAPASAATQSVHRVPTALGVLGSLTDLTIDRLALGDEVAAAKFGSDRPVDDPERERQLLDRVRVEAQSLGIDADAAAQIFQDQIAANKVVQRGLFARWAAHPSEAPTRRPDLAALRSELDRLTTSMLAQLARTDELRHTGWPCRVQLALATRSGVQLRQLDLLHRQALTAAVPSFCPAARRRSVETTMLVMPDGLMVTGLKAGMASWSHIAQAGRRRGRQTTAGLRSRRLGGPFQVRRC